MIPRAGASGRNILVAVVIGWVLLGCGPATHDKAPADPPERDHVETACEMALMELERLIEENSTERSVSAAALAEARELFRLGRELYLEREYELALEMVEEAINILKE
jgi:hypothetical protein